MGKTQNSITATFEGQKVGGALVIREEGAKKDASSLSGVSWNQSNRHIPTVIVENRGSNLENSLLVMEQCVPDFFLQEGFFQIL